MKRGLTSPPPIEPCLRIAVTGHRWIDPDAADVRAAVKDVLSRLRAQAAGARQGPSDPTRRAAAGHGSAARNVAVVSCLAEGADRIVAAMGLEEDLRLEVVLPMPPDEYKQDFSSPASRQAFDDLLAQSVSTTVVAHEQDRTNRYAKAGTALLTRCDVLIALWDGEPSAGIGGTAYLRELAAKLNIPVVTVAVTRAGLRGGAPPEIPQLPALLDGPAERELRHFNSARVRRAHELEPEDDNPFTRHVAPYFSKADALAMRYRDTIRWAGRGIYGLAFAAVAIVSTQVIFFPEDRWLAWFEMSVLLLVVVILVAARGMHLLERWTSTRFLAERLRSAVYLTAVGAPAISLEIRRSQDVDVIASDWVGRALGEICFDAPLTSPSRCDVATLRTRLVENWMDDQIAYQTKLHKGMHRAHRWLSRLGLVLFGASVVAALLHALERHQSDAAPETWAYISIVAPALAAALTGYAAQREFLRRSRRALRSARDLERARMDLLKAHDGDDLRDVATRIDVMLQGEAADWYSLASTRNLELP